MATESSVIRETGPAAVGSTAVDERWLASYPPDAPRVNSAGRCRVGWRCGLAIGSERQGQVGPNDQSEAARGTNPASAHGVGDPNPTQAPGLDLEDLARPAKAAGADFGPPMAGEVVPIPGQHAARRAGGVC